jgi:hypothetical protein
MMFPTAVTDTASYGSYRPGRRKLEPYLHTLHEFTG